MWHGGPLGPLPSPQHCPVTPRGPQPIVADSEGRRGKGRQARGLRTRRHELRPSRGRVFLALAALDAARRPPRCPRLPSGERRPFRIRLRTVSIPPLDVSPGSVLNPQVRLRRVPGEQVRGPASHLEKGPRSPRSLRGERVLPLRYLQLCSDAPSHPRSATSTAAEGRGQQAALAAPSSRPVSQSRQRKASEHDAPPPASWAAVSALSRASISTATAGRVRTPSAT